jgi:hypothetical protein
MRSALVATALILLGLAAGSASAADPQPRKYVARYCSPSGDVCLGIFQATGIVFEIRTAARYFARYKVCVRPPKGARTCRTAPIRRQGSVYGSYMRWPRAFGNRGPGVYRVTWSQSGRRLGPTLKFTRP